MMLTEEEQEKLTKLQTLFGKLPLKSVEDDLEFNQRILKDLPESDPAHTRFFREAQLLAEYKNLLIKQAAV